MRWVWIAVAAGGLVAGTLYWLLVLTEGTYLGVRCVTYLYDVTAHRYDRIKQLQYVNEFLFLGLPLAEAVKHFPQPLVLDVATGTGRVPLALVTQPEFVGHVIGIDRSAKMLAQARIATQKIAERVTLFQGDVNALPFANESFNCLTCLESLEFFDRPKEALQEMIRVLKPGGVMLLSNRVGVDACFFPRRIAGRGRLERILRQMGVNVVSSTRWQVHYDLVWAQKPDPSIHTPIKLTAELADHTRRVE